MADTLPSEQIYCGPMKSQLHGLLLAGGQSSRMGHDKASLVMGDRGLSQAAYALALLHQFCAQAYLSLRDGQSVPVGAEGVPVLRDESVAEGPMAGLLAAFREAPDVAWLVLACDLPFVHSDLLARLVERHEMEPTLPFVACADVTGGRPEPLCAIYGLSAGPILARYAARGQFSPRRIMIEEKALLLDVAEEDARALFNVNTPQDLAAARAKASPR
jgi:molybdopterin-guanine dinucleotide biosynthesis protein A